MFRSGRRGPHDLVRVAARANHIGERFHSRTAIDVSDHVIILVSVILQKGRQFLRRTRFRQRTSRLQVGQNDALRRIDDLGRLGHEMNAAKQNDVRIRFRRLITQAQRVADKIGHVLEFRDLVVVGQDNCVSLALQLPQIFREINTEIYTHANHGLVSRLPMDSQTQPVTFRLGFIGAGKLAGSVIRGLVRANFCRPDEIVASEPNETARETLRHEAGIAVTAENEEVAERANILLLGVKPAVVLPALKGIAALAAHKLVISLAAGVRLESMERVSNARLMRALTNTPSAICQATTAVARGTRTTDDDMAQAGKIFGAIGVVVEVTEEQIDAVTALSGSGPAFVYTVIEALAHGGVKVGLPLDIALTLATQTVLGAASLASESKLSPEELRGMVVTPGGTTAAGLAVMEKHGTSAGLIAAVEAATKRGQEMAKENL